jgi:membrane protease YdiL (CAAX protease family)
VRPIFKRGRTAFEKIVFCLAFLYVPAYILASNIDLDILVYASFGTYVIVGLIALFKPKLLMEVLKKENEDYLVRNQRKIPYLKIGFRLLGLALIIIGVSLNYYLIACV